MLHFPFCREQVATKREMSLANTYLSQSQNRVTKRGVSFEFNQRLVSLVMENVRSSWEHDVIANDLPHAFIACLINDTRLERKPTLYRLRVAVDFILILNIEAAQ